MHGSSETGAARSSALHPRVDVGPPRQDSMVKSRSPRGTEARSADAPADIATSLATATCAVGMRHQVGRLPLSLLQK